MNKTLSGDMEPNVKALAHGPPSRIAKTSNIACFVSLVAAAVNDIMTALEISDLSSCRRP